LNVRLLTDCDQDGSHTNYPPAHHPLVKDSLSKVGSSAKVLLSWFVMSKSGPPRRGSYPLGEWKLTFKILDSYLFVKEE
jgi:hypothetical protein